MTIIMDGVDLKYTVENFSIDDLQIMLDEYPEYVAKGGRRNVQAYMIGICEIIHAVKPMGHKDPRSILMTFIRRIKYKRFNEYVLRYNKIKPKREKKK